MSAKAYMRGNPIYYDGKDWRYTEDDTLADDSKPCARCGKMPTAEGYDNCLGHIEYAKSACCGHGVEEPYVVYDAKAYLNQYLDQCKVIKSLERDLQNTKAEYDSISIALDGMPHGTGISDKTSVIASKTTDLIIGIMDERTKAIDLKKEIEDTIKAVKDVDVTLYLILFYRYILGWTFEKIAVDGELKSAGETKEMSYKWVCILHGRALKEVEKIFQ